MMRTAVIVGDFDKRVGRTSVSEATSVIRHDGAFYVRTAKGIRLPGGGIGIVFDVTDVVARDKLEAMT